MLAVSVIVTALIIIGVAGYQEVYGQTLPVNNLEVKHSLEHDGQNGQFNLVKHLKNDLYVLYYVDSTSCFLKTFEVKNDTITEKAVLQLSTRCYIAGDIEIINQDKILVAYDGGAKLQTLTIADDGTITKLGTPQNAVVRGWPSILNMNDDVIVMAGIGSSRNNGHVTGYNYDSSTGVISNAGRPISFSQATSMFAEVVDQNTFVSVQEYRSGKIRSADVNQASKGLTAHTPNCLLYTSPSPRDS